MKPRVMTPDIPAHTGAGAPHAFFMSYAAIVRHAAFAGATMVWLVTGGGQADAQPLAYQNPAPFSLSQRGFAPPPFQSFQLPPQDAAEPDQTPTEMPAHLRRQIVRHPSSEPAGTIIVDTPNTYLYYILGDGRAIRYGIGVGRDGFRWSGTKTLERKAEWPDWVPPREMIARQPYLPRFVAGGPHNPLGARALYIGGTIYRIHGTNTPSSIGQRVSSGCIRMLNEDVIDLYERAKIGGRVVVLPDNRRLAARL